MLCCYSRCHITRSVYVRVCYATFALDRSLQASHDQHHRSVNLVHRDEQMERRRDIPFEHHRDVQSERHGDEQMEHHGDISFESHRNVHAEHHRDDEQHRDVHEGVRSQHHESLIDSVHREVHIQLTTFVTGGSHSSMVWQPFVVTYYAELTTLCLRDSLTSSNEFLSLLSQCLRCDVYDIRLAALQFLSGVLHGNDRYRDDDDDDDDDVGISDDASVYSSDESREKLLCELVTVTVDEGSVSVCEVLVEMLMSAETNDECLVMVRPHTHTHTHRDHTHTHTHRYS